jgi:hypothetical protein
MDQLSETGYISDTEFECLYQEALLMVRQRFGNVGRPFTNEGGRVVYVDGVLRNEHELFELCWNREIADQIRRERKHRF